MGETIGSSSVGGNNPQRGIIASMLFSGIYPTPDNVALTLTAFANALPAFGICVVY